jgi:hypothetical protein
MLSLVNGGIDTYRSCRRGRRRRPGATDLDRAQGAPCLSTNLGGAPVAIAAAGAQNAGGGSAAGEREAETDGLRRRGAGFVALARMCFELRRGEQVLVPSELVSSSSRLIPTVKWRRFWSLFLFFFWFSILKCSLERA